MAPQWKTGRRRKELKSQTKELLHKIYIYFETEIERDPNSTVTAEQLVAHSTGLHVNAIKRALSEYKAKVKVKKEYPTKSRPKHPVTADEYACQTMRRVIHGFYQRDEDFPVMQNLHLIMKGDIDYQGSLCSLRRDAERLGFKWIQKDDNNRVLIEKHEVRYARTQYLSKIDWYKTQDRNIVYTGDFAIESSRLSAKKATADGSNLLKYPVKHKCQILLAGNQNELMKNTLHMYDGITRELREESECRKESFEQYENWLKFYLIPNLKPNSVVVINGGSPFHNRVSNPCPHTNSKKKEMMEYLSARNVPYSPDMYKPQLYQLVLLNKDKYNDYKTDALLREHGHSVLRLPAYHPDLNPIKRILSSVEHYIGKNLKMKVESVMKIVKEKIALISTEEWKHAVKLAEVEENDLKAVDKLIDEISEGTFKEVETGSEESEVEEDSDQSMDSD